MKRLIALGLVMLVGPSMAAGQAPAGDAAAVETWLKGYDEASQTYDSQKDVLATLQRLGAALRANDVTGVQGTLDGVLEALSWVFIRGKGFGIFSFMFGLSFALQMQRAERRRPGTDFRPRFAWRLLILFAIGWLHGCAECHGVTVDELWKHVGATRFSRAKGAA